MKIKNVENMSFDEWKNISPLPCLDLTNRDNAGISYVASSHYIYNESTICILTIKQLYNFTNRPSKTLELILGGYQVYITGYLKYHNKIVPCIAIAYKTPEFRILHRYIIHGTENGSGIASSKLKNNFGRNGSLIRKIKLAKLADEDFSKLLKYVVDNKHLNKSKNT